MTPNKAAKSAPKKSGLKKVPTKISSLMPLTGRKAGVLSSPLTVDAIRVQQGPSQLFMFKSAASILFAALSINRKIEDKDEGYQRALSSSRVQALKRFITEKNPVPGAIVVCLDQADYSESSRELTIPAGTDVGWVVDGQHRLAAAALAAREGVDIDPFGSGFRWTFG